jgi:hypothetical protein
MTEDFLHFIWKYGLFERNEMMTDEGDELQVIGLGEHNTDAGPDFLNSRIRIGHTTWAGNVEIHLRSSDWYVHKHHTDKAFDNVILHVVYHHDRPAIRASGEIIPTLTLVFDENLYKNYKVLMAPKVQIPCSGKIKEVDPFLLDCWLNSLVVERLQMKTEHMEMLLKQTANNWEEVFYIMLARSFGFGLNADPFELLARNLPWKILGKHRNSLFQTEALLQGQAGFLDGDKGPGEYYTGLRKEYLFLRHKYNLRPIPVQLWKFLRLRPVNFPSLRLAQFAALIQHSEGLLARVIGSPGIPDIMKLFEISPPPFWENHYTFEKTSPKKAKVIGREAINNIIINAVIPFLFIYGKMHGREDLKNRALQWLSALPPEKNRVTVRWEMFGIRPSSAFYSQGLLQLSKSYCSRKHCLACSVGTHLITKTQP